MSSEMVLLRIFRPNIPHLLLYNNEKIKHCIPISDSCIDYLYTIQVTNSEHHSTLSLLLSLR